jgi:hypothetical protein
MDPESPVFSVTGGAVYQVRTNVVVGKRILHANARKLDKYLIRYYKYGVQGNF